MSRVKIKPELLEWAIARAGQDTTALTSKIPQLPAWLSQDRLPTLRQLEDFARRTRVPLGYLFLHEPPKEELPITLYRTNSNTIEKMSVDLIDTIQSMERRQDWFREFLIDEDCDPLPFVGLYSEDSNVDKVAHSMREYMNLSESWSAEAENWTSALDILSDAIRRAGVLVFKASYCGSNTNRVYNVNEFRGFVLVDAYAPLIFINSKDWLAAQMFTLAHELAHIFLGKGAAFDLERLEPSSDILEESCNKIAAEFLVPAYRLSEHWVEVKEKSKPFDILARHFKVSSLVTARRALDLSLISQNEYWDYYEDYKLDAEEREANALEKKRLDKLSGKKPGGPTTQVLRKAWEDPRFMRAVYKSARSGELSYMDAYSLVGYKGQTYEDIMSEIVK